MTWDKSQLFRELQRLRAPAASACVAALNEILPAVERVLRSGGTSPLDFTLHDDQHGYRVAEWISTLLADQISLVSPYDLSFSLLAAYLHDIGMTPERGLVDGVYRQLLTGDSPLPAAEISALQAWLDEHHAGLVPPLDRTTPEHARLAQARTLTAHFARHRHNAWSEAWIREHCVGFGPLFYPGWIEDIVALCTSHHAGYAELREPRFDPQLVGPPAGILHLRHCACLLRVADVLDFDPERTPRVIFEHRGVAPTSEVFWQRDHHIVIERDGPAFHLVARPPNAYIHKAVLEVAAAIDDELELCSRLAAETHFEIAPQRIERLPNNWSYEPRLRVDLRPADNRYEYIDGTFRPDVQRVLELLGGTALYGSRWAALRELLQNAFDAVREAIATDRLRREKPLDPELIRILRAEHLIEVSVKADEEGFWLTCADSGIGMTKERLVTQFLVSGRSKGRRDLELERECRARGFEVGRTAQFGIGALSYFMLASRLELITTPREPASAETLGFQTGGIADFGELRHLPRRPPGTEVRLLLHNDIPLGTLRARLFGELAERSRRRRETRPETMPARQAKVITRASASTRPKPEPIAELRGILLYELEQLIEKTPCTIRVRIEDEVVREILPGWVNRHDGHLASFAEALDRTSEHGPARTVEEFVARGSRRGIDRADIERMGRATVREGELGSGLGTYRVTRFHFEGPFGTSICLPLDEVAGEFGRPGALVKVSWFGMGVEYEDGSRATELLDEISEPGASTVLSGEISDPVGSTIYRREPSDPIVSAGLRLGNERGGPFGCPAGVVLQADLTSEQAGAIRVDRKHVTLTHQGRDAIVRVSDSARADMAAFVREQVTERYRDVSAASMDLPLPNRSPWWVVRGRGLDRVRFPALLERWDPNLRLKLSAEYSLDGRPVEILQSIRVGGRYIECPLEPSGVAAWEVEGHVELLVPIYGRPTIPDKQRLAGGVVCEFPAEWAHVVGVKSSHWLWNRGNPVIGKLTNEGWEVATRLQGKKGTKDIDYRGADREAVAAGMVLKLIVALGTHAGKRRLAGEENEQFLEELWSAAIGGADVMTVSADQQIQRVLIHAPGGSELERVSKLPVPGPAWRLTAS